MYKLTSEQKLVITTLEKEPVVLVKAFAGTGKTSTSLATVSHFKPKKGFYTAYNKSIVTEAQEKFPSSMMCKTKHAFAYQYVPFKKIEDFTYLCITEKLSYPSKKSIMDAMDAFFLSSSLDMHEFVSILEDKPLEALTISYIEKMIAGEIPPTFNFLLKYLHLSMAEGLIEIEFDLAILDECQDTTAVFFEIFKLIKCPRKLIVGDPFQNIYGYMNTVNAFKLIDNVPVLSLTQSFRCSPAIAARVETFGKTHLASDFKYKGFKTEPDNTIAYIARTNGSILMRLSQLIEEGKSFSLTRPAKEIFALPMALATVTMGREVYHKKYKYLEKEYRNYSMSGMSSFYAYLLKYVEDEELHSCINFMNMLREKRMNIFELKKQAENMIADPSIWVVTAHSFKGRECSTVYIEDSMNRSVNKIIQQGGPENSADQEELNLGYVAITRARNKLLGCTYA